MQILFIRHGESSANLDHVFSNRQADHPLTEKGCSQVKTLIEKLASLKVDILYSSPVPRAIQSAQIIAEALGIQYLVTDALREFDVGILEGRSDESAWRQFSELHQKWLRQGLLDEKIPGGESYLEMRGRFVPFIENLIETFGNSKKVIALVSHGGIYRIMLPEVLPNISHSFAQEHPLANTDFVKTEWTGNELICREWAGMLL